MLSDDVANKKTSFTFLFFLVLIVKHTHDIERESGQCCGFTIVHVGLISFTVFTSLKLVIRFKVRYKQCRNMPV